MKKMLIFLVVIVAFGVSNSAYAGGIESWSAYASKENSSGGVTYISVSKGNHWADHHQNQFFFNRHIPPADMRWSYPPQPVQKIEVNVTIQVNPEKNKNEKRGLEWCQCNKCR